jgi:hypothetical protein
MNVVQKTKESFRDIMYALTSGDDLPDEEAESTTDATPSGEAPKESFSSEDKSAVESQEADSKEHSGEEPGDQAEGESKAPEGEDQGGDADKQDTTSKSDDEGGSQTIMIDGEEVTLEDIREWKKGTLRQADYTRKTQEAATVRKQAEAKEALVAEIVADEAMSQFIAAHPKALMGLLADPENTRAILGNAEEVQALWDDYELIADNPRLAQRFHGKAEDAESELALQREADNILAMANHLDATVDEIAKGFDGVDADEVRSYVLSVGRVPTGEDADPDEVRAAFGRLFSLFYVQDAESGNYDLNDTLIRSRFEQLAASRQTAAATQNKQASAHNAEVDAKLKDTAPPATAGGDAPAPTRKAPEEANSLDSVIHDLLGYGPR